MPHRRAVDWTLEDIRAVLASEEQENLMLDYKASLAIGEWTDSKRNELSKDICAFANSAGGLIIIGIGEVAHKPAILDDGVDTRLVSKEAIESALSARVAPRIDNLTIKEILNPRKSHHSYFVIGIPRSNRAPHMCVPFHRYYKRYNFECVPMEHYEVEDVRRRQSEPALTITMELQTLEEQPGDGRVLAYNLQAGVRNEGSVTAKDVLVRLYIPRWIVGQITWSPNGMHTPTTYNSVDVHRFDYYVRDGAGPIPIFPRDDQPYLITQGKSRRIVLYLPPDIDHPELRNAQIIAQVFAEDMRMRSYEVAVASLLNGGHATGNGNGNSYIRG
ncbi:MAG: AlbA family DNA-binding domain-containing protein [Armatimonadota bacterium]